MFFKFICINISFLKVHEFLIPLNVHKKLLPAKALVQSNKIFILSCNFVDETPKVYANIKMFPQLISSPKKL